MLIVILYYLEISLGYQVLMNSSKNSALNDCYYCLLCSPKCMLIISLLFNTISDLLQTLLRLELWFRWYFPYCILNRYVSTFAPRHWFMQATIIFRSCIFINLLLMSLSQSLEELAQLILIQFFDLIHSPRSKLFVSFAVFLA